MRIPALLSLAAVTLAGPLGAEVLRLRIVDPQDAAVPHARVVARGGGQRAAVLTDVSGAAVLNLPRPVEIEVQAAGFEPLRRTVAAAEATIRLQPATLRTAVEVVVTGEPLAGHATGTAAEIERNGARTVLDAVEALVPGAFVTRRGVVGYGIATNGTGGVAIRGIGNQPNTGVLVVVDGRPDFQGLMGHPLPDFYSLSDAAAVAVTEGPASVLYGSNAMGGVIEIQPSRPAEGMSTRLTSGLGSYLTGQHRLAHGARLERSFYSLAAGVSHTRGDRPSSAFRNQDGSVALGRDFSERWKGSLDARYGHFHVEDPGPESAPLHNSYARVGRGGFSLNLDNSGGRTWGYTRVYSSLGNHYITDGFRSIDRTTGLRVNQHVALTPALTVEGGTDVVRYGGRARNVVQGLDYGRHNLHSEAGFARAQWLPASRLRFHSGLRYEHHSAFGGLVVPEAGFGLSLHPRYTLSAQVGRGFRNPTIRELYLFPAPNPELLPEHLWNHQVSLQARPADTLEASVTAFYADLRDGIVVMGRFPNLAMVNAGRALNRGIETMLRWRPSRRVVLRSGHAWVHSTNLQPYVPEHKWNYAVEVDAGRAFLHFGGITAGSRWGDAQHTRRMDGYSAAAVRVSVPAGRRTSFFTMVDNLLNRRYEVVPGYRMPGINASGGLTVHF